MLAPLRQQPLPIDIPEKIIDRVMEHGKSGGSLSLVVAPPGYPKGFSFSFIYLQERERGRLGCACAMTLFADGLYNEVFSTPQYVSWPPPHNPQLAIVGTQTLTWPEPQQRHAIKESLRSFYATFARDGSHLFDRFGWPHTIIEGSDSVSDPRSMKDGTKWVLGLIAGRVRDMRLTSGVLKGPELLFRDKLTSMLERIRRPMSA